MSDTVRVPVYRGDTDIIEFYMDLPAEWFTEQERELWDS